MVIYSAYFALLALINNTFSSFRTIAAIIVKAIES
jgi:hypothetical protein